MPKNLTGLGMRHLPRVKSGTSTAALLSPAGLRSNGFSPAQKLIFHSRIKSLPPLTPEHLELAVDDPDRLALRIRNAGAMFLGRHTPEAIGDYVAGPNHVLPTGGCARMFSGLSVDDFIKKPTFQHLSREGLASLKDVVVLLAETEDLPLHARAVAERFRYA